MTGVAGLLLAIVMWGALAFGAVYSWAYWPLAIACAALGVWGIRAAGGWTALASRALVPAFAAVAAAIGIQVIPLPYGWFARVAPAADRLLAEYNTAYSVLPPVWHPLSISPVSTLTALGLFVALAVFLLGLSVALDRVRLDAFATALGIFGIGLAVFGVVQLAFAVDNKPIVYGFWRAPQGALPFGPFINKNHFAGWMVMALPVVFGCFCAMVQASWREQGGRLARWLHWATRPEAGRTALVGFCALAMSVSIVLTKSRSGIASVGLVLLVLAGFVASRTGRHLGRAVAVVAVVGVLVFAIQWGGSDMTASHFAQASRDLPGRLDAWRDTVRIIRDFPWFGTGLGTYWMAMLVYQTGPRDQIFFQAHNDYLQLAAEGGLLIGVPAAVAVAVLVTSAWRRFAGRDDLMTRWIRAGAVAGLVGIAAQSLVEFSLQLPGNAALFAVLLALAIHRPTARGVHARRV